MKKYTLRDNLISAAIGVVIAIPICIAASKSWSQTPTYYVSNTEIESVNVYNTEAPSPTAGIIKEVTPVLEEYEYTEEDLAEELATDELELLALCVEAEAGNQGLEGKRYVVDVILNRVDDPDFPDTITGVITQPYHFTTYWDGAIDRADPTEETFEAIRLELEERLNYEILYFTAGDYGAYGTHWKKIGDHYFCTK